MGSIMFNSIVIMPGNKYSGAFFPVSIQLVVVFKPGIALRTKVFVIRLMYYCVVFEEPFFTETLITHFTLIYPILMDSYMSVQILQVLVLFITSTIETMV